MSLSTAIRSIATAPTTTAFLSHGGGPAFVMPPPAGDPDSPFAAMAKGAKLTLQYAAMREQLPAAPKAIVVVSAHWEADPIRVQSNPHPDLLFDYYGFPDYTYELKYPAPGSPELSDRIFRLLSTAGIPSVKDTKRGYDHGVFIPLLMIYPEATIPVVEVSIHPSLDPMFHLRIGAALSSLRSEGVLILGSGQTTHNLQAIFAAGPGRGVEPRFEAFDTWLQSTVTAPDKSPIEILREMTLAKTKAPYFRLAHPREEHFTPIYVTLGAAYPLAVQSLWEEQSGASASGGASGSAGSGAAASGAASSDSVIVGADGSTTAPTGAAATAGDTTNATEHATRGKQLISGWVASTMSLASYKWE